MISMKLRQHLPLFIFLSLLAVSGATVDRPLAWLDAVTLVIGVLAFYVAYLMADELLRQASRLACFGHEHGSGS